MKRYTKNIYLLFAVLVAELNVCFTGASLIKFSPTSVEDIIKCIFDIGKYKEQIFWLQSWFICVFLFYLFVYFNLFCNLLHETPKYRSIKLYRYGKDRYLEYCRQRALYGNLYGIFTMAAGVLVSGVILIIQEHSISIDGMQCIAAGLQFVKLLLVIAVYASLTIYLMLRKNSNFAMCFMLCVIFVQLVLEIFTDKLHFLTYAGSYENMVDIIFLIVLNVAVNFLIRRSVKRISLC